MSPGKHIHTHTCINIYICVCVCVRVFFGVGVGFASHNVIYFWRNCGAWEDKGGEEGVVDKAGPTGVARVSHAALVLNSSGHRDTASPAPKERALYLTLSLSLTVSLSLSLPFSLSPLWQHVRALSVFHMSGLPRFAMVHSVLGV